MPTDINFNKVLGISNTSIVIKSAGIDPDAQAYFNANTAITSSADKLAINSFFVGLKADGIYTKIKAMYLPIWSSAAANKWNIVNPLDTDAAFCGVFSGGWTHSSSGILGNGTNAYLDTKIRPSLHMTSVSGSFGMYSRTNITAATQYDIGAFAIALENSLISKWTANIFYANYGAQQYPSVSNTDSRGHFITNRNSATNTTGYRNGSKVINTVNIGGLAAVNFYLGALNLAGAPSNYSTKEYSFAHFGDGLTDAEALSFYNRVQTLMTHFGLNV